MKKSDSLKEMQHWLRESNGIIQATINEAAAAGYTVPRNFATGDAWNKAQAEIEEAVAADLLFRTRELCGAYIVRTVNYCKRWLEMQEGARWQQQASAKGAA